MNFILTDLFGVFIIDIDPYKDERGLFARTFCKKEFLSHGLKIEIMQTNISFNYKKGTLRGMHYQVKPFEEIKIVSCTKGKIFDVVIDLRIESSTYKSWTSVELSEDNRRMLYIPEGFAHGFQTLSDETEVMYQMSEFYQPNSAKGVRYNDPKFNINWPLPITILSEKDKSYGDFE